MSRPAAWRYRRREAALQRFPNYTNDYTQLCWTLIHDGERWQQLETGVSEYAEDSGMRCQNLGHLLAENLRKKAPQGVLSLVAQKKQGSLCLSFQAARIWRERSVELLVRLH
jgi:hypothetical protein